MVLTMPQNKLYCLILIFIPILLNYFTIGHYITKRDTKKLVRTGKKGSDHIYNLIGATYLSEYYDDFGPAKGFKHVLVRRSSVLPSPLRSWCSLLPMSSTRYIPIRCTGSGDLPIDENECNAYYHCWKQLYSVKRCCPPGRHFDHKKRKCRSIAKARCSPTHSNNNTTPRENYFYVNKASNSPMSMPTWPPFFPGIISGQFWYPSFPTGFMPQPALFGYAPVPMYTPMYMGAPFYPPINTYQTQGYPTGNMVVFPPGLPGGSQLGPSIESQPSPATNVQVKVDLQGNLPGQVEIDQGLTENVEEGGKEVETRPSLMKGIDLYPTFNEYNVENRHRKRSNI